jgi:hypothetical protein
MNNFNIDFWLLNDEKSITVYDNDIARGTSIEEAVFIRRILYLWKKFNKQPIFIIPEKFCTPVGISIYSFRKITKQWETDNLIQTECKGIPLKKYYLINEVNLAAYLNTLKYADFERRDISCRIQQDELTNSTRYPIGVLNKINEDQDHSAKSSIYATLDSNSGTFPNQTTPAPDRGGAPSRPGEEKNSIQEDSNDSQDKKPIKEEIPETAESEEKRIQEKKRKKIYELVLRRVDELADKKIISRVREMTPIRIKLVKDRIKEKPSMAYWDEVFDAIEKDFDFFTKMSWFQFEFIFRKESAIKGDNRDNIINGNFDNWAEQEREKEIAATPVTEKLMFEDPKSEQMFQELKSMVPDKIEHKSEKQKDLSNIVTRLLEFATPTMEIKVAGTTTRGYCDFKQTFSSYWYEVYQEFIRRRANERKMPIAVSMIKIGSECWNDFERRVLQKFTHCDRDQVDERLEYFLEKGRYWN